MTAAVTLAVASVARGEDSAMRVRPAPGWSVETGRAAYLVSGASSAAACRRVAAAVNRRNPACHAATHFQNDTMVLTVDAGAFGTPPNQTRARTPDPRAGTPSRRGATPTPRVPARRDTPVPVNGPHFPSAAAGTSWTQVVVTVVKVVLVALVVLVAMDAAGAGDAGVDDAAAAAASAE